MVRGSALWVSIKRKELQCTYIKIGQLFPFWLLNRRIDCVKHTRELVAVLRRVNAVWRRAQNLRLNKFTSLHYDHTTTVLRPQIQANPGEPVLSQSRDLLERQLHDYIISNMQIGIIQNITEMEKIKVINITSIFLFKGRQSEITSIVPVN